MKKTLLYLFLAGLLACSAVWAKIPSVPVSELVADSRHKQATSVIIHIIQTYHYKKKVLDNDLSSEILDNYLDNLDQNRSFFTQEDINQFEKYRFELDEALSEAELDPAFEIFRRYRQRVAERSLYAIEILKSDFDFTIDEEFRFDRRDISWLEDTNSLNEIWRKRVKNDYLNLQLSGKEQHEIRETLTKRYTRIRTSTFQLDANDIFQTFINAYTTAIEPHTSYFSPRTSKNFDISMSLSLEGIGAVLRGESDYTQVQKVITGGPAEMGGALKAEDKIIGVGQEKDGEIVDVIGWRLDDVVDLIRGPKGSVVRLEILPKGTGAEGPSRIISITRDKIKLEEQAAQKSIIDLPRSGGRVGVIDVATFYSDFAAQARGEKNYKSTSRDVRKLLKDLEHDKVDGIIVDLRGNGGGSLSEALEFTGLFIGTGPIVQTKDSSGKIEINNDPDPGIVYGGPLAVLVDRNSASASEIYAGAIQDYRRGIIIGEPTFGKGTVQNIVNINRFIRDSNEDHGRLKTTIAQFFRISGGSNQHKGVIPDIIFPTVYDTEKHGERSLDNALPWDEVKPARYMKASAPIDSFRVVKELHEKRIMSDKLFQLLLKEQALGNEASSRKTVSLLASVRKIEREKLKRAKRTLQNEFRLAQGLSPLPEDDGTEAADNIEEAEPVDILLNETAQILIDLILPFHTTASNIDVKKQHRKPVTIFGQNL